MNASARPARHSRRRLLLFTLCLLAVAAIGAPLAAASASGSSTARAQADLTSLSAADQGRGAAIGAVAGDARTHHRSCVVHILVNGVQHVAGQPAWVYRYVRRHGHRVRVIRHVLQPLYASCNPPRCVLERLVGGHPKAVTVKVRIWVRVPRHGRLVRRRVRTRRFVITTCSAARQSLGTPVTLTVEPGSAATLNFLAFQRQAPLSGAIHGYIVGGLHLGRPNEIILTDGEMDLAPTPVFIDNACGGQVSAAIETGTPTTIDLDQTQSNTATLNSDLSVNSIANVVVRLPLSLRNGDKGCNQPYLTTGYDQEKATFFLSGKFTPGGVDMTSPPQDIQFGACLGLGSPTSPCNGFAIPIDVLVSTKLTLGVHLGS
jgi:hypothetical protein